MKLQTPAELAARIGTEVGLSDWLLVTQDMVDRFADLTDDHQFIHVDPVAKASSPFGGTIAHGYLTLSLLPKFLESSIELRYCRMSINYGANKIRFPSPMRTGGRMRGRFTLLSLERLPDCVQNTWRYTAEQEGADKPVCVAEVVLRQYF